MTIYPNVGAMRVAAVERTALAASILRLYSAISPPLSAASKLADFTEADYTGYVAKTLTTWNPPYIDPAGGATIQCGTQQFDITTPVLVSNNILGFYLEDATGNLIIAGDFPAPIPMAAFGDAIPLNASLNFGAIPV